MKKITKKHLLYALFIFSIVGNICFYMGKRKAKQEVISVTEELTEKIEEYEALTSELTKSGEELSALETEISEEKSDEKAMFAEVAAADYLEASRIMTSIHSATLDRLVTAYHLYDDTDDAYPKLIDTAMIPTADGEEKELFIIRHDDKSNEEMAPFWAYANSLILVDYRNGTDELLFQTENKEIERLDDIVTYYEYFDMEIQDVDGNGEEDFVLLIGGHCIYSGTPEWLEIFCLIGLQEKGEIHVISSDKEDWLREVIKPLYEIDEENIKVDIFLDDVKQHFGNGKTEAEQKADKDDNASNQLETYIASKDEQMSEWTLYNSRYFDQELLWENYVYDDSNHVKKLKIYKEHGDRGNTMHQIALYLYDYTTGEVEKQSVAGIFAKVMEERLLEFKDVELRDILYEDLNGDGISDIKMTAACIIEDSFGRKTEELYEITYWYQADSGEFVCMETEAEQAVIAYQQFMDGRCSAGGVNIYELAMPTREPDSRYPTNYAIIDVNGDDMPELNIKTARELTVISFEDGELRVFKYIEPGSVWSASLLNNGAFMYFSDRFSACSYSYFELDESGNEINELGFYWDENNGNYIPDEYDDFFFDGNACSMEEWYDKTREYLYTDENGREQIRNQVDWTTYCEADPFETNGQVLYDWISGGYQLTLYDKEHNEILSEPYPESMWIDGVSEDVLEIGISVGNPAKHTYYFNKETAQISDTFYNAIVVGDKYIAYMEDDAYIADDASDREERTLILSDVFKEGILYQEITRDFSKTAEPMSAVISIEMIDDETVRLEYYQGEDYTVECEDISIKPILTSYRIQDKHIMQDIEGTEIQLNICCPQIIYPDAPDIAAKINQSIEERIIKECVVEHSAYDFDYEVKYRGEECLSILFWGMRSGSGAYPNDITVGLTYDMTTGRLLHITDIIEKDKLQQKLEQKDFEQQHGIKVYYYEKDAAREGVNWFNQYWLNLYVSEKSSYEEGEHKTDFYLTPDKIGILYEVGHSFGDYIILEIERTDERE